LFKEGRSKMGGKGEEKWTSQGKKPWEEVEWVYDLDFI
jgi:hypothetical protein